MKTFATAAKVALLAAVLASFVFLVRPHHTQTDQDIYSALWKKAASACNWTGDNDSLPMQIGYWSDGSEHDHQATIQDLRFTDPDGRSGIAIDDGKGNALLYDDGTIKCPAL